MNYTFSKVCIGISAFVVLFFFAFMLYDICIGDFRGALLDAVVMFLNLSAMIFNIIIVNSGE